MSSCELQNVVSVVARRRDRSGRLFPLGENTAAQIARLPLRLLERGNFLAGGPQLIEVPGSHVLANRLDRLASLALGSAHGGFGHFHIDDLGLDEPAAFERIHVVQPLITLGAIGWLRAVDRSASLSKKPRRISPSGLSLHLRAWQ